MRRSPASPGTSRTSSRCTSAGPDTTDEAREAVTDLIHTLSEGPRRDLVLAQEMYTLAARHVEYRSLTGAWMRRSRQLLEQHFDADTARQLDALIEGRHCTVHWTMRLTTAR